MDDVQDVQVSRKAMDGRERQAVAVNAQEWAVYRERQGTMYRMYKCRGSALIKA